MAHSYSAVSGRPKYASAASFWAPHTGWYTAGFHGDFLPPLFTHKCVGWVNTLFPFPFFLETNSSFFSHPSAKKALKEEEKNPEDNIDSEKTLFFASPFSSLPLCGSREGGFTKQRRRGVVTAPFPPFPLPPGDAVLIYIFIIGTLRSGGRRKKKKGDMGKKALLLRPTPPPPLLLPAST